MPKYQWGETPFDDMDREELLRTAQRLWSGMVSARSCLRVFRAIDESSPYWCPQGAGGRALAKMDEVHEALSPDDEASESIYRSFFRYADDLLFENATLSSGWMICDKGHMIARISGPPLTDCTMCKRPMRPIEWRDLSPDATKNRGRS